MIDKNKKMKIAQFRFGVISDLVNGVTLPYGEREKIIQSKVKRKWDIPHSRKSSISRSGILAWIKAYKEGGRQIESLMPKARKDRGNPLSLSDIIKQEIISLRIIDPTLTVPTIIKKLKHKGIIRMDENIRPEVIYRWFKKNPNLIKEPCKIQDRRAFEAEMSNDLWQSDVMHGPKAIFKGINKKTYLHAIIDDHSRFILFAKFYTDERLSTFKMVLRSAIERRGVPKILYVDNGSCYSALNLSQITSCLGIDLKHTPPYTPQGRGKIERWFRTVRQKFLPMIEGKISLVELNNKFENWVEEYQNTNHNAINCSPIHKYQKNLICPRPAPKYLFNYFRIIKMRKVGNDRSIRINKKIYEAPLGLIGKFVELHYHEESPDEIEVYFEGKSHGHIVLVNKNINAQLGREYSDGEVFSGNKNEI